MNKAILFAMLALSTAANAFTPWQGLWWNPSESGSGYNVDYQNGVLVVTIYSYESSGDSEWYLASGPMSQTGRSFTGTLDKYRFGACINCPYTGSPVLVGNDGAISINFTDETHAVMQLAGRTTSIVPMQFGVENPPGGLLGEWVFAFDIISTFAYRYNFTQVAPATSGGNGMAMDTSRSAACELQVTGATAGLVLCVDLDSSGRTVNQYVWKFGIDQTYQGFWVSPTTSSTYSMKGHLAKWRNGQSKTSQAPPKAGIDPLGILKAEEEASVHAVADGKIAPEFKAQLDLLADHLRTRLPPQ